MTADRLSPQREAEIAAAVSELDADRTLSFGTWTAGPVNEKSVLPPELAHVVEDVLRTENGATIRGSVGVFGDERIARFAAMARTAVGDLLAELAAVRAERDEARARVADAIEYGIRIPDGSVLSPTTSLAEEQARLERYRDTWPEAVLVQRPVFHGEWTEATR